MTKLKNPLFIFLLLLLPSLLIACGSTAAPSGAEEAAPESLDSGDSVPYVGDVPSASPQSDQADAANSIAVKALSVEQDTAGIQVGFTDDGRPYRGNPDAPIVMEAFSDFQCPYCGRFSNETLPGLLENQVASGQVVLVYYDFPLNSIHPQAAAAANAARCAGEGGAAAYWAMHDRLFLNISEWSISDANAVFLQYADELGFGGDGFATCLKDNRHAAAVAADLDLGRNRGVGSTPSFFLNDQPVIGAYPLDYFNQAIAAVSSGESLAVEEETQATDPTVKPTPATIVMDNAVVERGDPDAAVTIIEYTDYQCPYCARHSSETLPRLIKDMVDSGRIRYVVKDFPLDSIHPEARAAAVAARCAAEQDYYWELHDLLFVRQAEWSGLGAGANDVFTTMATELSMDAEAFDTCLASGKFDAIIQENQDEGFALGVNGTPAFFINGFPVSGAQPYELFEYAVGLAEDGTLADAYVATAEEVQPTPTPSGPVEIDTTNAYSLGDPDAPVVMIEFTDYQCPFCRRHFLETFPQIKADYVDSGKVRYVFLEFPLTSIHPQAQLASEAARCAGDQNAYVEMHNVLFDRQEEWSGSDTAGDLFAGYAGELDLDTAEFTECLEGGKFTESVLADLAEGTRVGVTGTPAFFLNGYLVSGAQPYEVFRQTIEGLLADEG